MSSAAPGSLEEMLNSLGRRNPQKPKDMPPALPSRPTSRTRLPSNRRAALPEIVEAVMELSSLHHNGKDSNGSKWKSVGAKTIEQVKQGESPPDLTVTAASDESKVEEKLASPPLGSSCRESEGHENTESERHEITESELQENTETECFIDQV